MKAAAVALLCSAALAAGEIKTLRLEPAEGMVRAELHYESFLTNPKAVLILCPGANGSGEGFLRSEVWRQFARENGLGLVGLSFASPGPAIHDGTGYYYASKGSGEKLLEGLEKIYGRVPPLLLYGFSGGAHFTSRFVEWKPSAVLAWCAYSAQWWDVPQKSSRNPPGIVACGDEDGRYGASMVYFKQGRAAGKPWLWVSLPKIGHEGSAELDEFVRRYFRVMLDPGARDGRLVDVDLETRISEKQAAQHPALSAALPDESLFEAWRVLHHP